MFRPLARAGATAREMLITAASEKIGVGKQKLRARNGNVEVIGTQENYPISQN